MCQPVLKKLTCKLTFPFYTNMTSAAYNLSQKLEWMSRQLRWINEEPKINSWIKTMHSLNDLLLVLAKNTEVFKDGWRAYNPSAKSSTNTHSTTEVQHEGLSTEGKDKRLVRTETTKQFERSHAQPEAQLEPVKVFTTSSPQLVEDAKENQAKIGVVRPAKRNIMRGRRTLEKRTTAHVQTTTKKDKAQPPCVEIEEPDEPRGKHQGLMDLDTEEAEPDEWRAKEYWRKGLKKRLSVEDKDLAHYKDKQTFDRLLRDLAEDLNYGKDMFFPSELKELITSELKNFLDR